MNRKPRPHTALVLADGDYGEGAAHCAQLAGCRVERANTLAAAEHKLAAHAYDVVICDLDGLDEAPAAVLDRLGRLAGRPVIALSAVGSARPRRRSGAKVVSKPFVPLDLVASIMVDMALDGAGRRRPDKAAV